MSNPNPAPIDEFELATGYFTHFIHAPCGQLIMFEDGDTIPQVIEKVEQHECGL